MYTICRHVKTNGLRCGSPALKGRLFRYYHSRVHTIGPQRNLKFGPQKVSAPEDLAATQPSRSLGPCFQNMPCEAVPLHLKPADAIACSHRAARVQPLCNCTAHSKQTDIKTWQQYSKRRAAAVMQQSCTQQGGENSDQRLVTMARVGWSSWFAASTQ
jgi:hypothetical protein